VRSYGQYCAVAKALDVVGDRWNLLIVRELLLRDGCRYVDLLHGLPGIATNLLASRLRDLEQAGVVSREEAPPPIATTLFRLTERGEQLGPVLIELARWGMPSMGHQAENETFRGHWAAVMARLFPDDQAPDGPAVKIELRTGEETTTLEVAAGTVQSKAGGAGDPDLSLTGPAPLLLGVVAGKLDVAQAQARGLEVDGDPRVLERLRPAQPHSTA
jgi:DNA-binding HxlR family transcriptional regulator